MIVTVPPELDGAQLAGEQLTLASEPLPPTVKTPLYPASLTVTEPLLPPTTSEFKFAGE